MALQAFIAFDAAQEAVDGRGWKLTYWDDTDPVETLDPNIEYFQRLTNATANKVTVTNKALTTNVATLTTGTNHGFAAGMVVEVTGVDSVFDGSWTIASTPAGNSFTYARTNTNVGSTAATGYAAVPVSAEQTATITNRVLTSNVATITTQGNHSFRVGQWVTVALTTPDPVFDGTYLVTAVTSTTFSYARTNANVTTGATTGTAVAAASAVSRMVALFSADTTVRGYFLSTAEAAVLAANQATVNTTRDTSLTAEGLAP